MIIKTRFNIGDKVYGGKTIENIIVSYNSYFDRDPDIHYFLSDGYYKRENEIEPWHEDP